MCIRSLLVATCLLAACGDSPDEGVNTTIESTTSTASTTTLPPTTTTTTLLPPDGKTSDQRTLSLVQKISGDYLQPKSVVYSGDTGLVFAQNMMYRHNVSVFDRYGNLVTEISDSVDLADFGEGIPGRATKVKGSPVEAAFSPNGKFAYVSNYEMYGDGWNPVADDDCQGRNWDPAYVYRINVKTKKIDQAILVGAVPKFLAVTPNGKRLIVSNFCSMDVSIVDLKSHKEIKRIQVGTHPRGIAITQDSETAYIAVMGTAQTVEINLQDFSTLEIPNAGQTPRHLMLSPDDRVLYATTNKYNTVIATDTATRTLIGTVRTGTESRSMVISDDGTALYVVNYVSGTLQKIRTSDMTVLQTLDTGTRPVGITYDPELRRVWVANYAGSIWLYDDK